jgi:translation initiation factor IF-1
MVKNDAGGNKGKGLARKHVNAAKCGGSNQLRVATDDAEQYAIVSKMLGNGMCYVRLLSGGGDRLCIIRNKFKGRGKRDNILDSGSWVLVGLREWSSKQDTCDLLEVYNANERDRLLKNEPCFKSVTDAGSSSGNNSSNNSSSSSNVHFADSTTMKYSSMLDTTNPINDADDDDEIPMQQRVYDMPPSSDEDESDDAEDADETPKLNNPNNNPNNPSNPSNPNNPNNPNNPTNPNKPKFKVCEINVDDI